MSTGVEVLKASSADVGEGPCWDSATGSLLWVDIHAGEVYREHLGAGTSVTYRVGQHVGAAMPSGTVAEMVLLLRDGFHLLAADGSLTALATPEAASPLVRFNDGKVDPRGRAFGGTMPYRAGDAPGRLYRLDPGPTASVVRPHLGLSNGLGWSRDGATMYLVDSAAQAIFRCTYDVDSGALGESTRWVDIPRTEGMPDGLTVDDADGVWVALFGGGCLRRYTPTGRLDREIPLPVSQPTSMCFAGSDLATLVVSTARYGLTAKELAAQPLAGSLFAADTGLTGPASTPWKPL